MHSLELICWHHWHFCVHLPNHAHAQIKKKVQIKIPLNHACTQSTQWNKNEFMYTPELLAHPSWLYFWWTWGEFSVCWHPSVVVGSWKCDHKITVNTSHNNNMHKLTQTSIFTHKTLVLKHTLNGFVIVINNYYHGILKKPMDVPTVTAFDSKQSLMTMQFHHGSVRFTGITFIAYRHLHKCSSILIQKENHRRRTST